MHIYFRHHPLSLLFFFNDTATTEIYTLSLHDALPISRSRADAVRAGRGCRRLDHGAPHPAAAARPPGRPALPRARVGAGGGPPVVRGRAPHARRRAGRRAPVLDAAAP